jgi:hypothetical protein
MKPSRFYVESGIRFRATIEEVFQELQDGKSSEGKIGFESFIDLYFQIVLCATASMLRIC